MVEYRHEKWAAAEKFFRTAVQQNPYHASSYFKLGMCEFRQNKYDQAYSNIDLALEKDPSQSQWHVQLAQALKNSLKTLKKSNWEKEKLIRSHLARHPSIDATLDSQLVDLLKRQGKWWEEQEYLEALIAQNKFSSCTYFRLGEIKEIRGERKSAFENFKKAIEINESHGEASPADWFYRAGYLLQCTVCENTNYENAHNLYYENAIALDEQLGAKRFGVGVFHQQRALWKEARDAYLAQLANHPTDGELHYAVALAYDHCNQWDEASHHYQVGLAISGGQPKWHYRLAHAFEMQKQWVSAIKAYRYAILMDPKPPALCRHRLGGALAHVGEYQEAVEAHISIRDQPGIDLPSEAIDISLKDYKSSLSASAVLLLETETHKHPDEESAWYSLGKVYEKCEQWGKAADAYKKAIDRKSTRSQYWFYRLAYSLYKDGQSQKALSIFNTIAEDLLLSTIYKKEINLTLSDLVYSNGIYRFWFKLSFKRPVLAVDVHSLVIDQREVYTDLASSFHFLPTIHYQSKNEIFYSFDVDLREVDLAFLYHDYSVSMTLFAEDGCRYDVKRKTNTVVEGVKAKLKAYPLELALFQDQYIVYPYLTASQKSISFIKRHYNQFDDAKYRELELLAIDQFEKDREIWVDKKIWLIFEKFSNTAQDNAYYFFLDIVGKRDNVYYVIDKDSPDRENLIGYEDHVVDFMSKEHMLMLLSCELLISSETRGHAYAWRRVFGQFREALFGKPYVFLQHGVTAMKKNDINLSKTSHICAADRFVVTSEFEKNIILKNGFGYTPSELIVAPFPRWHSLTDKSENNNEIFIMPTWRNWLEGMEDEDFRKSEYFNQYIQLLTSTKLDSILDKYGSTLNFYLHPKIIEQLKHFDVLSERIRVIQFGQESVRELLMRSKLLITDYSSVAWDFYYLKKPVLFFHFDVERYLTYHGSHIDFDSELPGCASQTKDDLLANIERCLKEFALEKSKAEKIGENLFKDSLGVNGSEIIYNELVSYCDSLKAN
nr:CDP-glycerol glycerophosphotransferase family protein [Salinicola acroporae]